MSALDVVRAIWGDGWHSLCAKRDGEKFRTVGVYATPDELLAAAAELDGEDVWLGEHGMADPPERRGTAADVTSVVHLHADLDFDDEVHAAADLPDEVEVRRRLDKLGDELAPSIVVHSGHGLQVRWLLTHDVGHDAGEELQRALDARLGELGLHNDRGDLASVMRVPGTFNMKSTPVEVAIESADLDRRFTPEYLRKRLPKVAARPGGQTGGGGRFVRGLDAVGAELEAGGRDQDADVLVALLDNHGAHHPYLDAAGVLRVTRPGTEAGSSATIGFVAPGILYVFSPSWSPFKPGGHYVLEGGSFVDMMTGAFVGDDEASAENGGPPTVIISARHLGDYVDEVVDRLAATNDPPTLFAHGGGVAELDDDQLVPLDDDALLDAVERRLRIVTVAKRSGDHVPAVLTGRALKLSLRRLRSVLPPLDRLASAPFMRADGTICQTRGYDPKSRLYLVDDVAVDVPDRPTGEEVGEAVAVIDDLLVDFPFRDDASRAHAWSLMFTAATRHLYRLAPCHAIDGNNAGVGKGLLAEVMLRPTIGDAAATTDPLPLDVDEQRKSITTALASGVPATIWDEAHVLAGTEVARLLTSHVWRDRLLGVNRAIEATNAITTVALGNQMRILGDLRRRVALVQLESELANPGRRTGFRHADLKTYAADHRGEVLSSVLTILRAWHVAGRPPGTAVLGSFEAWSAMVGGVLAFVQIDGFLDNQDVTAGLDDDALEFGWHLAELRHAFGSLEFQVREVLSRPGLDPPSSIDTLGRDAGRDLGNLYRRNADRAYEVDGVTLKLRRILGHTAGRARWTIETGGQGGQGGHGSNETNFAGEGYQSPYTGQETSSANYKQTPPRPPRPPRADESSSSNERRPIDWTRYPAAGAPS